jgi:putative thioredoxin
MNTDAIIFDATEENFNQAVVQASQKVPVLVDFWAPWCGPCKTLMPLLVKVAEAYAGKFRLAKVNIDEQQQLAAHFGVRSVPTVKLVKNGQLVDEFMGALPESQIQAFIDKHIERESDALAMQAMAMYQAGQVEQAIATLNQAWQADPQNPRLPMQLLEMLVAQGDLDAVKAVIDALPAEQQASDTVQALKARLAFINLAEGAPDIASLEKTLKTDPANSEARYQLAVQLLVSGQLEPALDELLELMRSDRQYKDDAARKTLIQAFDMLGNQGEIVSRYRSKMASMLY